MSVAFLQGLWFFLVAVLLAVFTVLDGFDMGVGFWHLFAKGDKEKRTTLNAIGPTWDGNEVWLLTGGGALFAAFPPVYATVFSGFYLAVVLLALVLILRAVSLEFRSKVECDGWRATWDKIFAVSSTVAALLFGVALGNVMQGIPMDANGDYTGTFLQLLNPYALVVGLTGLGLMLFHGALFMVLKAPGEMEIRAVGWAKRSGPVALVLLLAALGMTVGTQPHLMENYDAFPVLWIFPTLGVGGVVLALLTNGKAPLKAFVGSCVALMSLWGTVATGMFPRFVPHSGDLAHSLTAYNSSSSEGTLVTMLILALVGLPFVIGYTVWIYWQFRGKVDVEKHGHY